MNWEPGKPSQNENEYFARRDAEWLKEQRATLDRERTARTHASLACPRCGATLTAKSFDGVTVDACGSCHGVWLDSGELAMLAHESERELLRIAAELDRKS
ncbi:MAG: zf-TFIIB domain-containing protein [bacterium]